MRTGESSDANCPGGSPPKRLAAIILSVLLSVALAACGQLPSDEGGGPEEPSARWNEATWDADRWN